MIHYYSSRSRNKEKLEKHKKYKKDYNDYTKYLLLRVTDISNNVQILWRYWWTRFEPNICF